MNYSHERSEPKWKTYNGPLPTLPAPAWWLGDLARDYLFERELNPKVAGVNGWYPADMDVPRMVIPCINSAGTVYWQARAMDGRTKLRYDSPTAPRGDSIVAVHPLGYYKSQAVIVEGPMDALAAAEFGYLGIALMGKNPAAEALELIVTRFGRTHVPFLIIPDKDDEGFGATLVAAFANLGATAAVRLLTHGKDLCEMTKLQREKFLQQKG